MVAALPRIGLMLLSGLGKRLGSRRLLRSLSIALLASLGLVAGRVPGFAQTWLYTGTDYGTGANWSTGVTPGAGQTATFNSTGANQPIVAGNFTIATVNQTAGSITINTTRTLSVQTAYNLTDASILGAGTGTLSMGAGSLLTAAGSTAMTISPIVAGTGAVLITGSNVSFTGANTYSGTTTINAGGVLNIGSGATTGTLGTAAVTDNGT